MALKKKVDFKYMSEPLTQKDARKIEWKIKRGTATGGELLALFWYHNP